MKTIEFQKKVKTILQKDKRYSEDAYEFVNDAVIYTVEKSKKKPKTENKHITGRELLDGVIEFALREFGPLAFDVLSKWGINEGVSIGNIVFNMVKYQILSTSEEDSIEDFKNYPSFEQIFDKYFRPKTNEKKHVLPIIA